MQKTKILKTIKLNKIFILISCFNFYMLNAQIVSTLAGNYSGYADGNGTNALFNNPIGVVVDVDGTIYVADTGNNRIRKISPSGVVTTLAGSTEGYADGTGTNAMFSSPTGVALDTSGNVFVADLYNNRIRKITPSGVVTTLAGSTEGYVDGSGITAKFYNPYGLAINAIGDIFVADTGNNRIRKISTTGIVTTLAGSTVGFADGIGTSAKFIDPIGVAVDAAGTIFVADSGNNRIRKISPFGEVTTLAGSTEGYYDGIGTAALFFRPYGLTLDTIGNVIVADSANNRVRKITSAGIVSTIAGTGVPWLDDGPANQAQFNYPVGATIDASGNIYIADENNHRIRKITTSLTVENHQLENKISLYPNPTSSIINIASEEFILIKTTIFGINGRELQVENHFENNKSFWVGNLINGIYFIQITTDKGTICKKIIKQ